MDGPQVTLSLGERETVEQVSLRVLGSPLATEGFADAMPVDVSSSRNVFSVSVRYSVVSFSTLQRLQRTGPC